MAVPVVNYSRHVLDYASARQSPPVHDNEVVIVRCRSAIGDGGEGIFRWNPSSVHADDDGAYLTVTSHAGAWERVHFFDVDARWYGAKGDGVTDDRAAIQSAINLAATLKRGKVVLPNPYPNFYLIGGTLTIIDDTAHGSQRNVSIDGGTQGSESNTQTTIRWNGPATDPMIAIWSRECTIENICLDASNASKPCFAAVDISKSEGAGSSNSTMNTLRRVSINGHMVYGVKQADFQGIAVTYDSATGTFTSATAHGFSNGDTKAVKSVLGSIPSAFTAFHDYFVVSAGTTTFKLSLTFGGAAITGGTAGTGTIYAGSYPQNCDYYTYDHVFFDLVDFGDPTLSQACYYIANNTQQSRQTTWTKGSTYGTTYGIYAVSGGGTVNHVGFGQHTYAVYLQGVTDYWDINDCTSEHSARLLWIPNNNPVAIVNVNGGGYDLSDLPADGEFCRCYSAGPVNFRGVNFAKGLPGARTFLVGVNTGSVVNFEGCAIPAFPDTSFLTGFPAVAVVSWKGCLLWDFNTGGRMAKADSSSAHGSQAFGAADTTKTVTLPVACGVPGDVGLAGSSDATPVYKISFSVGVTAGAPAAGALRPHWANRGIHSFDIVLEAAPGAGASVEVDWRIEA